MKDKIASQILQQTTEIYNRIAPDFSNTRSRWWEGFGDFAKYVQAGDKVLDVGCGNGRMAELFLNKKIKYYGLDNSKELINIAAARFASEKTCSFSVGDILGFDLPKKNFKLILCIAVIHHLPAKELRLKALQNIFNHLAPGGIAIISTWNLWQSRYWRYLLNYKMKISRGTWSLADAFIPWRLKDGWQPRYVHAFSKKEMKQLLTEAGLEIISLAYENKGKEVGCLRGFNLLAIARKK